MLTRENTQALKGFAAIGILVFHILLGYDISPLANMWGGHFVALFLVLSGYGLEESFRRNGLNGFWHKRLRKVILPTAFFICAYNFLFHSPFFILHSSSFVHDCLDELLYIQPTFWFVFFVVKCYAVYWVGTRFLSGRLRLAFFFLCAFVCLNLDAPCGHLEAEQSMSFLAGVLLSMKKDWVESHASPLSKEKGSMVYGLWSMVNVRWTLLLLLIGAVFLCLKTLPPLHSLKGSIAYNYLLCPFRLSVGLAFLPLLTMLRLWRSRLMMLAGKYSLEIYVAHIPFIGMITDVRSTLPFLACSTIGLAILLGYRRFVEGKLSLSQAIFIALNATFVAKYSARVSDEVSYLATLGAIVLYYVLLRLALPYYIYRDGLHLGQRRFGLAAGCVLLAFVGMLVVQYAIDPYGIQVDRWSALHFPIENLLAGVYPYSASTHLGGNASPFPIWQLMHIPFFIVGNVGLSFFAAAGFFLWSLNRVGGRRKALEAGLLMASSVAVWYEVAVRSDLITNFLLVAALTVLILPRLDRQEWVERHGWWIACAVGLLASTRVLVLVPIAILLLPNLLKMSIGRQLSLVLLMSSVFVLTFVPFALWDWQEFYYFQNNPWALQTRQGHLSDFLIFLPLGLLMALNWQGCKMRYYRNSALMLVVIVGVTFVHNMYQNADWDIFSPAYDITYLSTALPFCLLAMGEHLPENEE